jgi:rubrerythrin
VKLVTIARPDSHSATRRELLRGGLAAATIAGAEWLSGASAATAQTVTDADVLHRLLEVEQLIAYSYGQVLAVGVLSPRVAGVLTPFLAHEQRHLGVLGADLSRHGGRLPSGPASDAVADSALSKFHVTKLSDVHSERDAIELLIGAEAVITGTYYLAIAELTDPAVVTTAAQAMANEAQHATVLRHLLHPHTISKVVPRAFVEGRH